MKTSKAKLKRKNNPLVLIVYSVVAALFLLAYIFSIFISIEYRAQDSLYQNLSLVSPDIYVIGIDSETLEELGPFDMWSREKTAEIINLLCKDPDTAPAVIGLDIGFFGNKTAETDDALVRACEKAGNVVVSSTATFGKEITGFGEGFSVRDVVKTYETPFDALKSTVICGHTNSEPDSDGIIRHSMFKFDYNGETVHSFAAEIYKKYIGEYPAPRLSSNNKFYIHYSGLPMDYFGTSAEGSSFVKVLNGEYPSEIFAGSVVLIGAYAPGMMDSFYTPVSRSQQMYGVEIHANILQAMLDENYKSEVPFVPQLIIIALFFVIAVTLIYLLDFKISGPIALIMCILYVAAAKLLYTNAGLIMVLLYPLAGVIVIYIINIAYKFVAERREKRRLISNYGKYLSPELAKSIADQGEDMLKLGGQKKDVAVLFVDIRGFTTLSESLSPEQVVSMLNRYLHLTASSVFANNGTVDKFIGDATMALFNAPLDLDDYVYKAVKTGLDMAKGAELLESELSLELGKKVGFGVGIHCGDAVIGNIGTSFRMDYTAIGDTVNTASRLEGQAKAGEVIISAEVYRRLEGRIDAECLGARQLKGKADGFVVYRVNKLL